MLADLLPSSIIALPYVFTIILAFVSVYVYISYQRNVEFDVPKYVTSAKSPNNDSKFDSLDDIMKENYAKDKDHIYKVEHPHKDVVIMPTKYVDELMAKPDNEVNFLEDINDVRPLKHTR